MKKILVILAGFMISCGSQATSTESNTETGVETEQVQEQKKVINKSIEKTGTQYFEALQNISYGI